MNCEQLKSKLSSWFDKELSPQDSKELEAHLSSCSNCSQEVKVYQELKNSLLSLKPISPSPEFSPKLWQTLYEQTSQLYESRVTGWRRWLIPTLATGGLAFASYLFFMRLAFFTPPPVYASGTLVCQIENPSIEGSCCVAPMETQLKAFKEIESVTVDAESGKVILVIKPDKRVKMDEIARSLKKCGGGTYSVKEFYILPNEEVMKQ